MTGTPPPRAGATARSSAELSDILVTVVVPAFNAAATLDDTLASVRAQTHRALEIIVVDDGSNDATAAIALAHASDDRRVRLIRQPQGGVAAARNRGLSEARAEYIAFVDSDDLWRPEKISRQLAVMLAGGSRMGLVYTWYALIDAEARILSLYHRPRAAGSIFLQMCRRNLIGNGSSALFRRSVLKEIGGFDPSLRARGAQGCEDIKVYLQVAERADIGLVPEHLTGYRLLPDNMSSDVFQMLRSRDIVNSEISARLPMLKNALAEGRLHLLRWLYVRSLTALRPVDAARLCRQIFRQSPVAGAVSVSKAPVTLARAWLNRRRASRDRGRADSGTYFLERPIPASAVFAGHASDERFLLSPSTYMVTR